MLSISLTWSAYRFQWSCFQRETILSFLCQIYIYIYISVQFLLLMEVSWSKTERPQIITSGSKVHTVLYENHFYAELKTYIKFLFGWYNSVYPCGETETDRSFPQTVVPRRPTPVAILFLNILGEKDLLMYKAAVFGKWRLSVFFLATTNNCLYLRCYWILWTQSRKMEEKSGLFRQAYKIPFITWHIWIGLHNLNIACTD